MPESEVEHTAERGFPPRGLREGEASLWGSGHLANAAKARPASDRPDRPAGLVGRPLPSSLQVTPRPAGTRLHMLLGKTTDGVAEGPVLSRKYSEQPNDTCPPTPFLKASGTLCL